MYYWAGHLCILISSTPLLLSRVLQTFSINQSTILLNPCALVVYIQLSYSEMCKICPFISVLSHAVRHPWKLRRATALGIRWCMHAFLTPPFWAQQKLCFPTLFVCTMDGDPLVLQSSVPTANYLSPTTRTAYWKKAFHWRCVIKCLVVFSVTVISHVPKIFKIDKYLGTMEPLTPFNASHFVLTFLEFKTRTHQKEEKDLS